MKFLIVGTVLVFAVVAVLCEEKYTTKYDNINLDDIIKNDRLMKKYIDCTLDKGPCTPDGAELKSHITDALQTGCSKCSETQKNGMKKVIRHLTANKKDWWNDVKQKYDPTGEYKEKYADWISKEGVEA